MRYYLLMQIYTEIIALMKMGERLFREVSLVTLFLFIRKIYFR